MDCNLTDDAIPKDLGSLSSLVTLRLNNNSFHILLSSLKGLSRLRSLSLDNCTRLHESIIVSISTSKFKSTPCSKLCSTESNTRYVRNVKFSYFGTCKMPWTCKMESLHLQNKTSIATTAKESFLQVYLSLTLFIKFMHFFSYISCSSCYRFRLQLFLYGSPVLPMALPYLSKFLHW